MEQKDLNNDEQKTFTIFENKQKKITMLSFFAGL